MSSSSEFNNPNNPPRTASSPGQENHPSAPSSGQRELSSNIKEKARKATAAAKEKVASTAEELREKGRGYAEGGKTRASERITGYGRELDETAERIEDRDPNIAWLTHRAADCLTDLGEFVRESDFRSLWNDAESVARRHPVAFIGGMLAAGVAIGTFVRAAGSRHEDEDYYASEPYLGEEAGYSERSPAIVGSDAPSSEF